MTPTGLAYEQMSIGDRLQYWAETDPDKPFVDCADIGWCSYGDMAESVACLAGGLQELGVGQNDAVAFLISNRIEYVELFLGCVQVGAIQAPLNPYLRGEFLRYQLDDSDAETIVLDSLGLQQLLPLIDLVPKLRRIVMVGDGFDNSESLPVETVHFDDLKKSAATVKRPNIGLGDLCSIIYTSGTTGMPKGCMMSHGYYLKICREMIDFGFMGREEILISPYQMFHTSGQVYCLTNVLNAGASLVLEGEFHASTFIDRARQTNATVTLGPGAVIPALLKQPPSDNDRDNQLRVFLGCPVTPEMQAETYERFGIQVCAEVYGQTEVLHPSLTPSFEPQRPGTAGKLSPYFDVRIVDDDDNDVPLEHVGEIIVRPRVAHGMFQGYWKKPEETLHAWRNLWHHTGDNGRIDAAGYLTFADRKKDSLRRRGENVSSIELEQAILMHPGVQKVAVHAIPSDLVEDDIKACIVPMQGVDLSPEELFDFFKQSLPYFAIPRYVELMDDIPTSTMARVQKFRLVDRGVTEETWDFEQLGLTVERSKRRTVY